MAKIDLFDGLGELEVLALFAIIPSSKSRATSEREKSIGLEILNLINVDGKDLHINYLDDKYALVDVGYADYDEHRRTQLTAAFVEYLNRYKYDVEVSQFELDDNDDVTYSNVYIEKKFGEGTKSLRRFVYVRFNGELLFADIYGLDEATRHLKADRDRNTKGLQWENLAQLVRQGVVY